jgi:hypothetical protein
MTFARTEGEVRVSGSRPLVAPKTSVQNSRAVTPGAASGVAPIWPSACRRDSSDPADEARRVMALPAGLEGFAGDVEVHVDEVEGQREPLVELVAKRGDHLEGEQIRRKRTLA